MNFNPELSGGTAIFLALAAAFMWGTWAISLKYLGNYPIDAFYVTLFATSLVLVWSIGFLFDGRALVGNIVTVWSSEPLRVIATFVCGGIYVSGIRISLTVMSTIGLSLAQPIQSATLNLVTLAVTIGVGGVPAGISVPLLILATLTLTAAVVVSLVAGRFRSQAQSTHPGQTQYVPMAAIWRSLGLVVASSLLIATYPFALSFGLVSTTQPHGMAVLPFMAVLGTGAFVGAMLGSGLRLTLRRQWGLVWRAGFHLHKFGIWSGLFHYGGNIIQAFATSFLSAAVAFPLGITSGLWTQMWGLAYGEFRGSPPKAYIALFGGVLLYIIGAYLIAIMAI